MYQVANNGKRARSLLWLGIAAAAIVAIAVFRIQLSTVLYVGSFLVLPFLMMRMHGSAHGGHGSHGGGGHDGSSEQNDETREQGKAPAGLQH